MQHLLTTGRVARICGVTPPTVHTWIDDGKLPATRTDGGHRRVTADDLRAFAKTHSIKLDAELLEAFERVST